MKKVLFYILLMVAFIPLLLIVHEGDSILPNIIGIGYLAIWACILNSPIGDKLYNKFK